jgi:putative sigma-54 modulation protein
VNIDIRTKNLELTPSLKNHIQRRLAFALGAREDQIQRVQVMLSDVNGPRGGEDKRCRVLIRLRGLKDIVIEDCQSEMRTAIDRTAARASQTLARKLMKWQQKRVQSLNRNRHQFV